MSFIGISTIVPHIVNLPGQTGEGISAAFSYSKSSFRQDESDPTPTITGTQGGTFSSTPSGLSINSSTGTIDLSISDIRSYTITYTVQGVSAQQSLSVISPLSIDNNFSMKFDGSSYIYGPPLGDLIDITSNSKLSISCWIYSISTAGTRGICATSNHSYGLGLYTAGSAITFRVSGGSDNIVSGNASYLNGWHHVAATYDESLSSNNMRLYFDGSEIASGTSSATGFPNYNLDIGALNGGSGSPGDFFLGNIDEFAVFNEVLSATTIQDIYNATANNSSKVYDLNQVTEGAPVAWYRMGD